MFLTFFEDIVNVYMTYTLVCNDCIDEYTEFHTFHKIMSVEECMFFFPCYW